MTRSYELNYCQGRPKQNQSARLFQDCRNGAGSLSGRAGYVRRPQLGRLHRPLGGQECLQAEPDLPHVRLDRLHGVAPGVHQEEGSAGAQGGGNVGQAKQEKELK